MKNYKIKAADGCEFEVQLSDEDAKRRGIFQEKDTRVEAEDNRAGVEGKAAPAPKNKSRTARSK